MLTKRQRQRHVEMSTLATNDQFPPGLRILARMIARCYLEENHAQSLQNEIHSDASLTPEGIDDKKSLQGSNDQSRSDDNEH